MIPYLGCEVAREMLEAFIDGELAMADQVAVESHLRWCRTCGARVEDMRLIGGSVRMGAARVTLEAEESQALAAVHAEVLMRIGAEHDQSFGVRVREAFE